MKILTDSIMMLGKTHNICEDYALDTDSFVVVCDGCSSSKNTDIGARLLAHYYKKNANAFDLEYIFEQNALDAITNTFETIKKLGIDKTAGDATFLTTCVDDGVFHSFMVGDGHFIFRKRTGEIVDYKVSYKNSMPSYLSYKLDLSRGLLYDEYIAKESPVAKVVCTIIKPNGEIVDSGDCVDDSLSFYNTFHNIKDYDMSLISTDGIDSFQNIKTGESVVITDVLKEIMNFKVMTPQFLKRRIKRMVETFNKNNIYNFDDISLGAIFIDE